MVIVRCPSCGHTFQVDLRKGKGAHYVTRDFKPSLLHLLVMRAILDIVREKGQGATKEEIRVKLEERGRKITGNSLSGRLSELLKAGYVEVVFTEVERMTGTPPYRFRKTPLWYLTEKGFKLLQERALV
jgi:repressor of nif and glnA expression